MSIKSKSSREISDAKDIELALTLYGILSSCVGISVAIRCQLVLPEGKTEDEEGRDQMIFVTISFTLKKM